MENVIYKIINVVNNKFYVGSTVNTKVRFRQHRRLLRKGTHHCRHLQAAWSKYGEASFTFVVVETVAGNLQAAEDVWLQANVGEAHCYNSGYASDAPWRGAPKEKHPNFGKPVSEIQRLNTSLTLKAFYAENYFNHPRVGTVHSEEARAEISRNRTGKCAGQNHYRYGKTVSEETRKKIGDTQRGVSKAPHVMSEQGRANIAATVKRGAESHFYGKRPTNADDLQKAIHVIKRDRSEETYPSLTYMRDTFGVSIATIIRACKSGNPVRQGVCDGWVMSYADAAPAKAPEIPDEFKAYPHTRQEAKETGAKKYFTGIPCERGHISPRKTKGTCIACAREDYKKENDKRRAKPQ